MDEGPINHILTFDTAHDMWEKLLSVYDKKSEASVHMVQQKFFNYKYKGQELAAHVSSLRNILDENKQTLNKLMSRLIEEERVKSQGVDDKRSAFVSKRIFSNKVKNNYKIISAISAAVSITLRGTAGQIKSVEIESCENDRLVLHVIGILGNTPAEGPGRRSGGSEGGRFCNANDFLSGLILLTWVVDDGMEPFDKGVRAGIVDSGKVNMNLI
ncbi:hypothetical protein ILUMI_08890 [Ignelater luminosus]|uniref:Uncharacterized protein n=1 Tax=Ignelater luminosus TaxID=2038154 RepID=A0A8K0GFK1_IGNLU|nr:hypothetical protein ILUMI_08890 [Ignelater luminosus]